MTRIELIGAVLSASGVFLETQRIAFCWPINMFASGCYLYIFTGQQLYADAALQIIFISLSVYGWIKWRQAAIMLPRLRPRISWFAAQCAGTFFAGLLFGYSLSHWTKDPAPFTDALLTSMSILATYWMARRLREAWLLWIVTNSAYVVLFTSRGLNATAALYAGFALLAVFGWYRWSGKNGNVPWRTVDGG